MPYPNIIAPTVRPKMSFEGEVRTGFKRHHIIPWHQMAEAGAAILNTKYRAAHAKAIYTAFIKNSHIVVDERLWGNGVDASNFIEKLMDPDSAITFDNALEAWFSIIAWLPGNLVIGTGDRGNDPEDSYDKEAHQLFFATNDPRAKAVDQLLNKMNQASPSTMTFEDLVDLAKGPLVTIEKGWKK